MCKRHGSSVAMMLLMSFLLVGGSWRSGDGWITGISRANGKRLSSEPTDRVEKMIKIEQNSRYDLRKVE